MAGNRGTPFAALAWGALALLASGCGGADSSYPPPRHSGPSPERERAERHRAEGEQGSAGRNIDASYYPREQSARRQPPPVRRKSERRYAPPEDPLRAWTRKELERIYDVQSVVREASRANRIPVALINGIIWVESKFHVRARGRKGPRGLMQIMPRTGRWLARELGREYRPYDHRFNIHAGTFYFARMLKRYHGNVALALAAYNAGPGTVDKWLRKERSLPDETRSYVNKVLSAADAFRIRGI
jgi:soluble lytic murein transglycosylase-like protein